MLLGHARGKVGDVVFSRRLGQQTTRAYVSKVNDATTRSQVSQRSKLGNLVSSYRAYRTLLQRAFETKNPGVTDYNRFVGDNLAGSGVFLTKEEVAAGACVVAAYIVSKGTLPQIQVVEQVAGSFMSDIGLPAGFDIDATTTIAQLSEAIVSANADWMMGDQFTAVHAEQFVTAQGGIPMCSVRMYDIVLSPANQDLVRDTVPATVLSVVNGYLGFTNPDFTGGVAAIHSRREASGALKVSSSRIILTQNNQIYSRFAGISAEERAVASRGFNDGAYLDPGSEHGNPAQPITPNVVLTEIRSGGYVWPAEDTMQIGTDIEFLGENLSDLDGTAIITFHDATTATLGAGTVSSGARVFDISQDDTGKWIRRISIGGAVLASFNEGGGFIPDPGA